MQKCRTIELSDYRAVGLSIRTPHENPDLRKRTGDPLLLVTTSAVIRDLKLKRYIILRNNQSEDQFAVSSGFSINQIVFQGARHVEPRSVQ